MFLDVVVAAADDDEFNEDVEEGRVVLAVLEMTFPIAILSFSKELFRSLDDVVYVGIAF